MTVVLTHGFSSSGTMTLQNKQPTQRGRRLSAEAGTLRNARKLGGSSTLLGKILFNII